jgi:hypothetical protein
VLEADAGGPGAGQAAPWCWTRGPDVVWKARVKKVDPFPKPSSPRCPAQYFGACWRSRATPRRQAGQRLSATIVLDELPKALVVPRQAVFRKDEGDLRAPAAALRAVRAGRR